MDYRLSPDEIAAHPGWGDRTIAEWGEYQDLLQREMEID